MNIYIQAVYIEREREGREQGKLSLFNILKNVHQVSYKNNT